MRKIGAKYHTASDIYKFDGTMIPSDEPVILFRARDRLVPQMLDFYLRLRHEAGSPPESIKLLSADIEAIKKWQQANPDKLRTPQ